MTFAGDADGATPPFRVCFVCTGNICRSPMAEVVFRDILARAGLQDRVYVSSAGTGDWHVGEQADARTLAALSRRGYDGSLHRARQFEADWFDRFDLIVVLDRSHERILRTWAPTELDRSKVQLLSSFDGHAGRTDVPDPYYSDEPMFDAVLATIERSAQSLFTQLEPAIRASRPPTKGQAS